MSLPTDTGIVGTVFEQRRTQISSRPDTIAAFAALGGTDDTSRALPGTDLSPSLSIAAVPLQAHDQISGVLVLIGAAHEPSFAREALDSLEGLANLTAAAMSEEHSRRTATTLSEQLADSEAQQRSMTEQLTSAEASLLQAAKLAAVGQLAAAVAHEINNPLYATRNALVFVGGRATR